MSWTGINAFIGFVIAVTLLIVSGDMDSAVVKMIFRATGQTLLFIVAWCVCKRIYREPE